MFAIKSGVTDDDGNLVLSLPSYVEVTAVIFDEAGKYRSSDNFYPTNVSKKEYNLY
jgi:hypothetical protein